MDWLKTYTQIGALLVLLVSTAVVVTINQTLPAFAGLTIVVALCAVAFLVARGARQLSAGLGFLATAALIAVVAEMAEPDWPMGWGELAALAVSAGLVGITMLAWDKRREGPRESVEKVAGVAACFGLLAYALVAAWRGAGSVTTPIGLVAVETLAGLADLAGDGWRWRLSGAALVAFSAVLGSYLYPGWPELVAPWVSRAAHWMFARTNWPLSAAGLGWLLFCAWQRPGWQSTLTGLVFILLAAWIARAFWISVGVY